MRRFVTYHLDISIIHTHTHTQPATQQLLDHFIALVSSDLLLYSEKCMFIEVFVMLNHFRSTDQQDVLLTHLLSEIDALVNGGLKRQGTW